MLYLRSIIIWQLYSFHLILFIWTLLDQVHSFSAVPKFQTRRRKPPVSLRLRQRPYIIFSPLSLSSSVTDTEERRKQPQRKTIVRDWTYTEDDGNIYQSKGNVQIKVFLPRSVTSPRGCVFFMHGFSQLTIAYQKTLMRLADYSNVAIVSADTGITSWIVLGELLSRPLALIKDGDRAQFVLQRALYEDTKQCIRMLIDGDAVFQECNIDKSVPIGVCGHSMGGGLAFPIAAEFDSIEYVFAMAPFAGVTQYDPVKRGVNKKTVNNSMILAGSWDFIAKADNVKKIAMESDRNKSKSSIFVDIDQGSHTGFEDELVLEDIPLDRVLGLVFGFLSTLEKISFFIIMKLLGTNTGQLEGSQLLLEYFFDKMAKGEKVVLKAAEQYLVDNIETKWDKKFNMTYV